MDKHISKFVIFLLIILSGCAGTDGSGGSPEATPPPVEPQIVQGKLSAIDEEDNTVTIDDTVFTVSDATVININGQAQTLNELDLGQVVRLVGVINTDGTGSAEKINYIANAIGPIQSFDINTNELLILGQTYLVNDDTFIFDLSSNLPTDSNTDSLQPGVFIELSALPFNNESMIASNITILPEITNFTLSGFIETLDIEQNTLTIQGLTVDFSEVTLTPEDLNTLEVGAEVLVFAEISDNPESSLLAFDLILVDEEGGVSISTLNVTGPISQFESKANFSVLNNNLSITNDTVFINGEEADLAIGAEVRIQAIINDQNINIYDVQRVEFISKTLPTLFDPRLIVIDSPVSFISSKIIAPIESVEILEDDPLEGDPFVSGTVQLLSEQYPVSNSLPESSDSIGEVLDSITDFSIGEWVIVEFFGFGEIDDNSAILHARQIEPLARAVLFGTLTPVSESEFSLLNQNISINADTTCFNAEGFTIDCSTLPEGQVYVELNSQLQSPIAVFIVAINS